MIKVSHDYSGRPSQKRLILSGVYDINDERLFGLGQYLLDNGHAVDLELPVIPTPESKADSTHNALNLNIMGNRLAVRDGELVATIGIDPAIPNEDKTIETLVELLHDETHTVTEEVSSDNPNVQTSVSSVKPSKLHKPQSKK